MKKILLFSSLMVLFGIQNVHALMPECPNYKFPNEEMILAIIFFILDICILLAFVFAIKTKKWGIFFNRYCLLLVIFILVYFARTYIVSVVAYIVENITFNSISYAAIQVPYILSRGCGGDPYLSIRTLLSFILTFEYLFFIISFIAFLIIFFKQVVLRKKNKKKLEK